jgi:hypothetical protein
MSAPPAQVAALLRRYLAELEAELTRQALIRELEAYTASLEVENVVADALAGRLRRLASAYDADAERLRRRPRRTHDAEAA